MAKQFLQLNNGKYYVTEYFKEFRSEEVQRQIRINQPNGRPALAEDHPAHRTIYRADNG